jgi:hypothetical protein
VRWRCKLLSRDTEAQDLRCCDNKPDELYRIESDDSYVWRISRTASGMLDSVVHHGTYVRRIGDGERVLSGGSSDGRHPSRVMLDLYSVEVID